MPRGDMATGIAITIFEIAFLIVNSIKLHIRVVLVEIADTLEQHHERE